jgi:uncharacterized NAD(P)/FAD-binding protein YdhS
MRLHLSPDSRELTVAIVGGGASGTLVAVQLLHRSAKSGQPVRIWLIDQHGRHGRGQAYSTEHGGHLLNAVAGRMSALPGEPDDLVGWAAAGGLPDPVSAKTFLPRQAYGRYLRDTLAAAQQAAAPHGRLTELTASVTAIRPRSGGRGAQLEAGGRQLDADVVVLATGNVPAPLPFEAPDSDQVISDPWRPGALRRLCAGRPAASGRDRVVIVGTGLTMVDLAIAITSAQPAAIVHAVSRHALLPRVHYCGSAIPAGPMWLPAISRPDGPVRLTELMWQVRQAVAGRPDSWPAVLDALRPHIPGLWQRLPPGDQRAFLRHVARYWEVHRHLMPPATAARITTLRLTGRLIVHRGRVAGARPGSGGLSVLIGGQHGTAGLDADWLVNGTGGTADITATASPLLRGLFDSGLARPDGLRLGIDADRDAAVLSSGGQPTGFLYAIGPPLRGVRYETTAIPEIRDQASALVERVFAGRVASRNPGSAA